MKGAEPRPDAEVERAVVRKIFMKALRSILYRSYGLSVHKPRWTRRAADTFPSIAVPFKANRDFPKILRWTAAMAVWTRTHIAPYRPQHIRKKP